MPILIPKMKAFFPRSKRQIIFILTLIILTTVNGVNISRYCLKIQKIKHILAFQFDGYKFGGLEEILRGAHYVSYYTDKDLNNKKNPAALKQFSQAQYILAPVILDPENLNHPFILFDCASEEAALRKIKELGAVPLKRNKFGIILAKRTL